MSKPQAGVGRTRITPFWGVELTGWGYYLNRTWQNIRDHLNATAVVIENGQSRLAIISLDLMVISAEFTADVRSRVAAATDIPAGNILVCCTHTHNAPASGGLLGVGEVDEFYERWAARQTATAAIQAWHSRTPARLAGSTTHVDQLTFNRTRVNGPVDTHLTTLWITNEHGVPQAALVGFQGHPTVSTELQPYAVSRDVPGEICDHIESAFPGCIAMYLQGACGDVNFHRHFANPRDAAKPGRILADAVLKGFERRQSLDASLLAATSGTIRLPTRRWTREEIEHDRTEAEHRLQNQDTEGWRESIGRVMTNRPDDMIARHGGDEWRAVAAMCHFNMAWTDRILQDLDSRPEWLETEIQAIRIGDFGILSNSSELFTTLALSIREQVDLTHLAFACYANGRIGYLPDAHDVERRTYAAFQSPKYCNQFPFTAESGSVMVNELTTLVRQL
ncbi:MAG: hypothetical protein KDA81_10400 [Planctomycetaceae bacterium]|nr:hypothetical protein [Planctomycetaceae bacterium]